MGKRVLIADNDALLRSILSEALTAAGYAVAVAEDGLDAWQQIQAEPPAVLVLDLIMPNLDGARVCRYVKTEPRLAATRVLILSATAAESRERIRELGADGALAKRAMPDMVRDVLEMLRAWEGVGPAPQAPVPPVETPRQIVVELLAETAHLSAILAQLGEGVVLLDRAGRIRLVNAAGERLLGRTELELVGTDLGGLLDGSIGSQLAQGLRELADGSGEGAVRVQTAHLGRTLLLTLSALREEGRIQDFLLMVRDVSAYAERIRELSTLNALAAVFGSTLDLDRLLRHVMEQVQQTLQVEAGSLLLADPASGELVFRVAVGEHRQLVEGLRLMAGKGIAGWVFQEGVPLITPDAQADPRFYPGVDALTGFETRSMLCVPLRAQGKAIGVIQAITDRRRRLFTREDLSLLTAIAAQATGAIENARLFAELSHSYEKLRRAQDELIRAEKLRALGQMAAGIAHDLNNMLAAVLGQAEVMRLRLVEPALHENLRKLETAAKDGARVVRRLQDFARQRPGAVSGSCDPAQAIQEALELTRPRWEDDPQGRGQAIEVRVGPGKLPPVQADPAEVRELLANLILNAVDAMPQGGTLTLCGRLAPPAAEAQGDRGAEEIPPPPLSPSAPQQYVELCVSDTGIGMTDEVRQRIFDPFFTTKGVAGTGLGLSVVYGILERCGGKIEVVSTPGAGTTMTVRLPVAVEGPAPTPVAALRRGAGRRVLVIDDEESVREAIVEYLRLTGHEVVEAGDGAAGLARFRTEVFDCVLTDLGMPGMTGWEVARAIRAGFPSLPIILLTGWGNQVASETEVGRLVDKILRKPIPLHELAETIEGLVGGGRGPEASTGQ